jgi:type II secretory pathway pseudopilin PulG
MRPSQPTRNSANRLSVRPGAGRLASSRRRRRSTSGRSSATPADGPAIRRDLARLEVETVDFGGAGREQVVARPRRGDGGNDRAARAAAGLLTDRANWKTSPNSLGWRSLPWRIGRASGSGIETSRSVMFSPADRCRIWRTTLAARSAACSILSAAGSSGLGTAVAGAAAQALGDAARLARPAGRPGRSAAARSPCPERFWGPPSGSSGEATAARQPSGSAPAARSHWPARDRPPTRGRASWSRRRPARGRSGSERRPPSRWSRSARPRHEPPLAVRGLGDHRAADLLGAQAPDEPADR